LFVYGAGQPTYKKINFSREVEKCFLFFILFFIFIYYGNWNS
jgi:hypothetical protein